MEIFFLILGVLSLVAGVVLMFRPVIPAAIASYAAMWLFHLSYRITVTERTFIFWGAATFLLMTIARMKPKSEPKSATANAYITIGSLAGMLLAMTVSANVMLLGVLVGAVMGMIAFVNTPKGKFIGFSTSTFIHYFCSSGLPIAVAVSMIGIIIEGFLINMAN